MGQTKSLAIEDSLRESTFTKVVDRYNCLRMWFPYLVEQCFFSKTNLNWYYARYLPTTLLTGNTRENVKANDLAEIKHKLFK